MKKWDEKNYIRQKTNSLSSNEQEPSDITISIKSDSMQPQCKDTGKKRKPREIKRKKTYTCPKCKIEFVDWEYRNRVFCSRKCAGIDENMDVNAPRKCTKCGIVKNPEDFFADSTKKITGRRPDCKECNKKKSVDWARKNRKKRTKSQYFWTVKYKYNLTEEQYNEFIVGHVGKFAICNTLPKSKRNGKTRIRMHVDHCHKTGKVRGLLCYKCNSGIGLFEDDITRMKSAIKYIRRKRA
jgi:hypothetical protein